MKRYLSGPKHTFNRNLPALEDTPQTRSPGSRLPASEGLI